MGSASRFNNAQHLRNLAAQSTAPVLLDAYGRRVVPGGIYAYTADYPVPMEVIDITPDLRPNVPPGQAILTLAAQVQMAVLERAPIQSLLMVTAPPRRTTGPTPGEGQTAEPGGDPVPPDGTPDSGPDNNPAESTPPAGGAGIVLTDS